MEMTTDQVLSKALESQLKGDLAQADIYYAAILSNNPLHPDANFRMGTLALQLGRTANASSYFIKAIDAAPERIDFWIAYMNYLRSSNQERDASLLLEKARQSALQATDILRLEQIYLGQSQGSDISDSDRVEGLRQLIELYQDGDLNNLVNKANFYVRKYPDQFQAHNIMGAAFSALKKRDEAIASFEQAVKIKPDYSEGYNNLGLAYREKGELLLAVEALKTSIKHNQDYSVGLNNLGATLIALKKFEEALTNLNRAVELAPQYAEAHNNRGITLASLDRRKESEESFRRALEINPNYSEAHNNLGKKFFNEDNIEEAIESFEKAVLISPRYADAYTNLGKCCAIQGDLERAIEMFDQAIESAKDFPDPYLARSDAYLGRNRSDDRLAIEDLEKAISLNPFNLQGYHQLCAVYLDRNRVFEAISVAVRGLEISPNDAKLNRHLGFCLVHRTINDPYEPLLKAVDNFLDMRGLFRPGMIAPAVISCVKANKEFLSCLDKIKSDLFVDLDTLISSLVGVRPLIKLLRLCPLPDLDIEKLLKKARQDILISRKTVAPSEKLIEFLSAQATQCFLNEYIYEETENEKALIRVLEQEISQMFQMDESPSAIDLLCLASYRSLHQYKWAKLVKKNIELEKIIKLQIEDIEREKNLLENITMLAPYQNEVSIKVQSQYEENPYPRWINLYEEEKPLTLKENLDNTQSRYKQTKTLMSDGEKEILIAGCGTGRHPIEKALAYKNSNLLAVDLSAASLGYALRKTEELGITNINYLQADILDLKKMGRQFDLIESAGVLHHMQDPMAGWHVLTEVLRPGGIMMIGLYSEIAREKVVKLRQEIKERGINNDVDSIKRYRQELIEGPKKGYVSQLWGDFFSTSEIRDLLFHVQEHRFTIPRIKSSLEELGLEFSGFRIKNSLMNSFKDFYGDEADTFDLGLWDEFEEKHPDTFAGMYQFWCQKGEG